MEEQENIAQIYDFTFKHKLIYIFTIHDEEHNGCLKIGEHKFYTPHASKDLPPNCEELKRNAHTRIAQYTKTAMVKYELLYTELARRLIPLPDGTTEATTFSDHDVQNVLYNSGYTARKFSSKRDSEWFEVDLETAICAVQAVKEGRAALSANEKTPCKPNTPPIVPREEQARCVSETCKAFRKYDTMLWNCKMRFGKTVTAYELILKSGYAKVLIVTHRPSVESGWREDFNKVFGTDSERVFLSRTYTDTNREYNKLRSQAASGHPFVYFASMQDLRDSVHIGGHYDKNNAVFEMDWDLIIYDEAHEGTRTNRGQAVQIELEKPKSGKRPKTLHLSGTPYNLMDGFEDNVFFWDYVMEQQRKREWDEKHPGEHNPYADLPELKIRTFDLSKALETSYRYEMIDAAFNFTEFFRVWTGDPKQDFRSLPADVQIGDFVHEEDITRFLDIISDEKPGSLYPFATPERREMFRHTFWIVPGVKAASALSKLLRVHPVFGHYQPVNISGDGDEEMPFDDAVKLVREAIRKNPRTITISCGRLTVGATVPEWTAVMMLSGSSTTAAAGYMQTIFRVQSAGTIDGKQKECGYVFDFAPDRILNVLPETYRLQKRGRQSDEETQRKLGDFLNFCPVLAIEGGNMLRYDVPHMMRQIKRITVDKAIRSGFDDESVYKSDTGIVMDSGDVELINRLGNVLTPQKQAARQTKVVINHQGLTGEEYERAEQAKRKPKRELSGEEQELLDKLKKQEQNKKKVIALLRNISIRLPLLIYGADVDLTENIGMKDFIHLTDDESWKEFMPKGVTKELFRRVWKYYDEDVVIGAGLRIRRMARAADELPPTLRVQRIAEIFEHFRNPDKETVLTPWRVVNLHLSDTVGGYCFLNERFDAQEPLDAPRLVERKGVTAELLLNPSVKILEMNSKSGLYPLYMAYSLYAMRLTGREDELPLEQTQELWKETLSEHIFVLCGTKMARCVTRRTLSGYQDWTVNAVYLPKLLEWINEKMKRLVRKLTNPTTWGKEGERLKFDAIIGNPPYQLTGASGGSNDAPIYQHFAALSEELNPRYASLIMPARWFTGGRENLLGDFRNSMLKNRSIREMFVYPNSRDIFPTVEIKGGLCYYLIDASYSGDCAYTLVQDGERRTVSRRLDDFDILIRDPVLAGIVKKVSVHIKEDTDSVASMISGDTPFGIPTNPKDSRKYNITVYDSPDARHNTLLYYLDQMKRSVGYIDRDIISKNAEDIDKFKVFIPEAGGSGNDPYVLSKPELAPKNSVCSQTYLYSSFESEEQARNFISYLKTKFFRTLVSAMKVSQHAMNKTYRFVPVQDFSKPWTDAELYKKYGLTADEIAFVEAMIKPME